MFVWIAEKENTYESTDLIGVYYSEKSAIRALRKSVREARIGNPPPKMETEAFCNAVEITCPEIHDIVWTCFRVKVK